MRKIGFDNNITSDCPISDLGDATTIDCLYCKYFKGFHGSEADCVADDPDDLEIPLHVVGAVEL